MFQQGPGLQVLRLEVKKSTRKDYWRPSMISKRPPELHPDLGRGTADRTDPPNVASLKETRQDTGQRMQSMRDLDGKTGVEPPSRPFPVFIFRVQMKNSNIKPITEFVWAYHLPEASGTQDTPDQQYLCNVRIEPNQTKLVKVTSSIPRFKVVNASAVGPPPTPHEPTFNDIIINQIQFADNDKWQRSDWNPLVLSLRGAKKLGKGMCIAL
jgi:hypothetical protein